MRMFLKRWLRRWAQWCEGVRDAWLPRSLWPGGSWAPLEASPVHIRRAGGVRQQRRSRFATRAAR